GRELGEAHPEFRLDAPQVALPALERAPGAGLDVVFQQVVEVRRRGLAPEDLFLPVVAAQPPAAAATFAARVHVQEVRLGVLVGLPGVALDDDRGAQQERRDRGVAPQGERRVDQAAFDAVAGAGQAVLTGTGLFAVFPQPR